MRIDMPDECQDNPIKHLPNHYAGDIVRAGMGFSGTTYLKSSLSLREFEAARVRTAQINGCAVCQAWRTERDVPAIFGVETGVRGPEPDPAFHAVIADWRSSDIFSNRERLALELAEGMGQDPQGIAAAEDFWARMKAAFTDNEIVDLSYCLAAWIGLGRATHILGMDTVCAIAPPARVAA
ncbi:MAG: carboxymuconolactone decarboxylase family protein [Sphingobium sp.]